MPPSRVDSRSRLSLIATFLVPVPILVMIYLVETHTAGESIMVCDLYPAGKVICCMLAASFLSVIAFTTSILPISHRRLLPAFSLIALFSGWLLFWNWYDWHGLFNHGKAWAAVEYAETADGIGAVKVVAKINSWLDPNPDPFPVERLTRTFVEKTAMRFSPQGHYLVYGRYTENPHGTPNWNHHLRRISPDGTNDRPLFSENIPSIQLNPSFSADGRQLLFSGGEWQPEIDVPGKAREVYICDIDADGRASGSRRIIIRDESVIATSPCWSPDGTRIAFVTVEGKLATADLDGENVFVVAEDACSYAGHSDWSPDGLWLCFTRERDRFREIYKVRSDGSELTRLTEDTIASQPRWSPNGEWLIYSDRDLFVIRANGNDRRRLTSHPASDYNATWDPVRESVVFISTRDGGCDLYRIRLSAEFFDR